MPPSCFASTANVTNPSSVADLNLDPSDFPALGGSNAVGTAASNAASNSLLSSYATQAGAGGLASQAQQGQGSFLPGHPGRPQREFSAEDFPALGGVTQQQDGQAFSQQPQQLNGSLTNGQPAQSQAQSRSSQEQASAAAALAHKQSLLGTMSVGAQNQARGVSNAAASTLLPDDALSQKRVSRNHYMQAGQVPFQRTRSLTLPLGFCAEAELREQAIQYPRQHIPITILYKLSFTFQFHPIWFGAT